MHLILGALTNASHLYIYTYMCVFTYVYIYTHVFSVYLYTCVYIYTHRFYRCICMYVYRHYVKGPCTSYENLTEIQHPDSPGSIPANDRTDKVTCATPTVPRKETARRQRHACPYLHSGVQIPDYPRILPKTYVMDVKWLKRQFFLSAVSRPLLVENTRMHNLC